MKCKTFSQTFAILLLALLPRQARATAYTWTPLLSGTYNWNNAGSQDNWGTGVGGPFPNAAGDVVLLGVNISGDQSINLNGNQTIGSLTIGDTDSTNIFTINSGGSLIFDNGGSPATLTKVASTYGGGLIESISASITLTSSLQMTNNSAISGGQAPGTLNLAGGISGPGGMTKLGPGTIELTGGTANTYAGPTIVNNGCLWIQAHDSIPDGSLVSVIAEPGVTALLQVGLNGAPTNRNERLGSLTLGGSATNSTANVTVYGTLYLPNGLTYDATNNPNGSTLLVGPQVDLDGGAPTFNIGDSATAADDLTINANITNGTLIKDGLGRLLLQASSTFSGGTVVKNGYLYSYNPSGAGTGIITLGDTTGTNATRLGCWGALGNAIVVPGGNTGTATIGGEYANYTGPITLGSGAGFPHDVTLTTHYRFNGTPTWSGNITGHGNVTVVNGNWNNAVDLRLSQAGGNSINPVGSIAFTGTGVTEVTGVIDSNVTGVTVNMTNGVVNNLVLSGDNTYVGPTDISSGTLLLNGMHVGGATYTIAAAGTLGGMGSTDAAVSVFGTISPGPKAFQAASLQLFVPGTLSVGANAWHDGGHFRFDIDDATGMLGADPGWDQLTINGALDISGLSANGFTMEVKSLVHPSHAAGNASNFNNQTDYDWPFVTFGSLVGTFDPTKFAIDSSGFTNPEGGGTFGVQQNGNSLVLTFRAVEVCGNGIVTSGEGCDDGNMIPGDGCDAQCKKELGQACSDSTQCGSGFCDSAGNVCACDDNADCPAMQVCNPASDPNVCVDMGCGNGVVEGNEECDDNNQTNGDGCDSNCTFTACGNGVVTSPEVCDDDNLIDGDGCDSNCTPTGCGNGVITSPEACDDNNLIDGDGCDSNCTPTGCGNGVITSPEACDDGNLTPGDGCDANCMLELGVTCGTAGACASGFCVDGVCCAVASCLALDQCHDAGTCQPGTGLCSDLEKSDDSSCDDGDLCTQTDSCQSGTCTGGAPVVCMPLDQCHDAGTCDSMTGLCSNPAKVDGSSCDDNDACTQTDSCQSGTCTSGTPVVCPTPDPCHDAGTCDSMTGLCSNPAKVDGSSCDDGDLCTQTDSCQSGTCTGANPVVCTALDPCHDAGTCDSMTGLCSNPAKVDGSSCDDGDLCTQSDSCQSGTCTGANPVVCTAQDECHEVGTCNPSSGTCANPAKPDGTPCTNGTCQAGGCVPHCTTTADCPELFECIDNRCLPLSEGPLSSAPGCACRAAGENGSSSQPMGMTLLALSAYLARRRRALRPRPPA